MRIMGKLKRPSWSVALAVLVGAADIALLCAVGVGPLRMAVCAVFFVALGLAGALCLRGREALFPDRLSFALAAVAFGFVLHVALCFVLFHGSVERMLGIHDRRTAAVVALCVLCGLGAIQLFTSRARLVGLPRCACPGSAGIVFALASIVAVAAHFGFGNDLTRLNHVGPPSMANSIVADFFTQYAEHDQPLKLRSAPEWGSRIDSLWYVWLIPRAIDVHGLPEAFEPDVSGQHTRIGQFQHIGVALEVLALTEATGPFGAHSAAACSKPLVLAWMVLFGWWMFLIGHTVLGLSARTAVLGAAGGLCFSSLDLTLLFKDRIIPSHVLTYVATPIYWNTNHLAHLAIGLCGVYLVLRALAGASRSYSLGCVLIASSLLYKPSLYFVAVPAIALASLRAMRNLERADVVLGWIALFSAAGFWFGYPRILGLESLSSPIALGFLELQLYYARNMVLAGTWFAGLSPSALKATIIVLVLAAWIVPLAHQARECLAGGVDRCRTLLGTLLRPEIFTLCVLFAWGMFSAWCFVEDYDDVGRRTSNNFYFGGAIAYTVCLPLLVLAIGKVEPRALRCVAWGIYALHLASGCLSLWIYAVEGRLT